MKQSKNGYVFIPAIPLGPMLLSRATDITGLNDNSIVRGETVYARSPDTGNLEVFTQLEGTPTNSDATLTVPLATARALARLRKLYPDCPIPFQVRYYDCDAPGKEPNNWTELIHASHTLFDTASYNNLTAQGPNVADAVPEMSLNLNVNDVTWVQKATQPGWYKDDGDEAAYDVVYGGGPGCGDCEGQPFSGCETIYALYATALKGSTNSGVSFSTLTTGITFTAGGALVMKAGRLIVNDGALMYYSDDPDGGASAWSQASLPAGVVTLGRMAANDQYVFALSGTSGVLRSSDNGSTWEWVVATGSITAEQTTDIDADGSVVFVGAANGDGIISLDNGEAGSWSAVTLPGGATDDSYGVHVAQWSNRNRKAVVLYVAMDDATDRVVYRSTDHGDNWSAALTFLGGTKPSLTTIESALWNCIIYVHHDVETYKSVGGGDSFYNVSNSDVDDDQVSYMALCPFDVDELIVIGGSTA